MNSYEVMIVFDPDLEDGSINSWIERLEGVISRSGGKIKSTEHWGKRRFAYEVKHKRDGYYLIVLFEADPVDIGELNRQLHLSDDVIRHKILKHSTRALKELNKVGKDKLEKKAEA